MDSIDYMSIFNTRSNPIRVEIKKYIHELNKEGIEGKLILLNFFEEQRISNYYKRIFNDKIIQNRAAFKRPIPAYEKSIIENNLLLLLQGKSKNLSKGLHVTSLRYLVENGFIDIATDENPPKRIELKKPLGFGKYFLWVSLEDYVDLNLYNSIELRNALGLRTTTNDFLYYFIIDFKAQYWIPSALDALGRPPYKPTKSRKWGITRNLIDDCEAFPELLILPLVSINDVSCGYLISPKINQRPPIGYIKKRLDEFSKHHEKKRWGI